MSAQFAITEFYFFFFFFNDTATTEIYTLSLHDALPIACAPRRPCRPRRTASPAPCRTRATTPRVWSWLALPFRLEDLVQHVPEGMRAALAGAGKPARRRERPRPEALARPRRVADDHLVRHGIESHPVHAENMARPCA